MFYHTFHHFVITVALQLTTIFGATDTSVLDFGQTFLCMYCNLYPPCTGWSPYVVA